MSICDVYMNAKAQRNDPCPCGSGKKYKKCCGLKEAKDAQTRSSVMHTLQKFGGVVGYKNLKESVVKVIKGGAGFPMFPGMPAAFNQPQGEIPPMDMSPEATPDDLLPFPQVSPDVEPPKSLS